MGACKLLVKENEGILVCGNNTRVVRIRVRDINYISCDNRIITIFRIVFMGKLAKYMMC